MINLIVLDAEPVAAARALVDAHIMEQPEEYVRLLVEARRHQLGQEASRHMLAKWASGDDAWWWVAKHLLAVTDEHAARFGIHLHAAQDKVCQLAGLSAAGLRGAIAQKPRFISLVPKHCKIPGNAVAAYRKWYHESAEPTWSMRGPPDWWEGSAQLTLQF